MHWNSIKRLLKYWYMTYDSDNPNENLRHLMTWRTLFYNNLEVERKVNKCYPTNLCYHWNTHQMLWKQSYENLVLGI